MPAPKKDPAAEARRGNPSKRNLPAVQRAEIVASAPPTPDHLGAVGTAAWTEAYASAPWLSTASDHRLALEYAELQDERDHLRRLIEESGRLGTGSMGQPVSHPYVEQLRAVESHIRQLRAELGLGPKSRAHLGMTVAAMERAKSALDELLAEASAKRGDR